MPKIILLKPLTHGSAQYQPGEILDKAAIGLTDRDAAWLVKIEVAVFGDSEPNEDGRLGEPDFIVEPTLPKLLEPDAPTPSTETEEEPQ